MSAAPEVLEPEGAEEETMPRSVALVTRPAPKDALAIMGEIVSPEALAMQTRISEGYDDYCRHLLGKNDVQTVTERGKTKDFKKKSAWLKLARAFRLSTEIVSRRAWWEEDGEDRHLIAEYTVRASAPWGQHADAVGVCSTRESRFRSNGVSCPLCGGPTWDNRNPGKKDEWKRKLAPFTCRDKTCSGTVDDPDAPTENRPNPTAMAKADHDVRATAQTRATNRAISNLIAAGEVSAEELDLDGGSDNRGSDDAPPPATNGQTEQAADSGKDRRAPAGRPAGPPDLDRRKVRTQAAKAGKWKTSADADAFAGEWAGRFSCSADELHPALHEWLLIGLRTKRDPMPLAETATGQKLGAALSAVDQRFTAQHDGKRPWQVQPADLLAWLIAEAASGTADRDDEIAMAAVDGKVEPSKVSATVEGFLFDCFGIRSHHEASDEQFAVLLDYLRGGCGLPSDYTRTATLGKATADAVEEWITGGIDR